MRKDLRLDLARETVRRYGALPADFAKKMSKRIRRKFGVSVETASISASVLHYKEMYAFAASTLGDYINPPTGPYADADDVDVEALGREVARRFPEDDSDVVSNIVRTAVYYEYLR
jgi:hypothetical protein